MEFIYGSVFFTTWQRTEHFIFDLIACTTLYNGNKRQKNQYHVLKYIKKQKRPDKEDRSFVASSKPAAYLKNINTQQV